MTPLKSLALVLFGFLLIAGISAVKSRQYLYSPYTLGSLGSGLNYYNTNYAQQQAVQASSGSTTAYNSILASPYSYYGLGGYAVPTSAVNYYNNAYNNYAAEQSASGSTTSLNENLGLGLGGLDYYNTNYANQEAVQAYSGSTTEYSSLQASPYSYGLGAYGYAVPTSAVNYYANNYNSYAAQAAAYGSTTAYQQYLSPYSLGLGYY